MKTIKIILAATVALSASMAMASTGKTNCAGLSANQAQKTAAENQARYVFSQAKTQSTTTGTGKATK